MPNLLGELSEDFTDEAGTPLAVTVSGAQCHNMKMAGPTLQALPADRPWPTKKAPQHLPANNAYSYAQVEALVGAWGYTAYIRSRGEETAARACVPGYRARQWVVERTQSWMNRFRKLLIRLEQKVENYLALLHLACAYLTASIPGISG